MPPVALRIHTPLRTDMHAAVPSSDMACLLGIKTPPLPP